MPAGRWAVLLLVATAARSEPPPDPQPSPNPRPVAQPSPEKAPVPPKRLHLDIERHVQGAVDREAAPLRFETSVEVEAESAQAAFERHLHGLDLECGPAGGGAPTDVEMRAVRPHLSPSADFLALGRWLAGKAKGGKGQDRYFLYSVTSARGVSYSLRGERVPDALLGVQGTTFELVATFPDRDSATRAWQRLERGSLDPAHRDAASRPPPWATSPCPPRD